MTNNNFANIINKFGSLVDKSKSKGDALSIISKAFESAKVRAPYTKASESSPLIKATESEKVDNQNDKFETLCEILKQATYILKTYDNDENGDGPEYYKIIKSIRDILIDNIQDIFNVKIIFPNKGDSFTELEDTMPDGYFDEDFDAVRNTEYDEEDNTIAYVEDFGVYDPDTDEVIRQAQLAVFEYNI